MSRGRTFSWTLRNGDGRPVVALQGELDLAGEDEFRNAMRRALEPDPQVLVVDLSGLDFIDSSGLRLLVEAQAGALDANRRLLLVRGPDSVRRVFELTGLADRFEFVD